MATPEEYLEESEKPIDIKYYFFLFTKNFYIILTFFIITVTFASIYAAKIPDRYQAVAQIMIEKPQNAASSSFVDGDDNQTTQNWTEDYYNTQVEIMRSPAVLNDVAKESKLKEYYDLDSEELVAERIRRWMTVSRVGTSRIFNITVIVDEPELSANLANGIARAYIRKNFEDTLYYSKEVLAWLPQQGKAGEKISIEDPLGGIKQVTREELIESLPALRTDETIRALKEKKSVQEADLESLLKQFREKHPLVIKARSNLKFLTESIDAEKARIIENLKSKAEGRYHLGSARVIEEAKAPGGPLPSSRWRVIIIAAIAEIVLSIMIIVLLDYFDDTIHSMEDLERKKVSLPFLGPIPLIKGKVKGEDRRVLLMKPDERTKEIAESFRYLRVAINFSASPESLRCLVFSSSLPHEGKSFIAHNIAISLAMDGNRTLLVDTDLRRPVLHKAFQMDNATGLSNYLTSNLEFDAVVKDSGVENLSLVVSGPPSPNPGEILGSDKMRTFLQEASKRYDRVIIDCPPLTGIGDGFVVGNRIGQIIMVIASGKTPIDLIKHNQKQLEKAGIKIIGAILNMVDMEKERHSGYSKHYYHTYSRYYGEESK